jgi:hypothetical protein
LAVSHHDGRISEKIFDKLLDAMSQKDMEEFRGKVIICPGDALIFW